MKPYGIVVLLSGSGSNFQAILDASKSGSFPQGICAVISNNPHAKGLIRASDAGIPAITLDHRAYPDRESYDAALAKLVQRFNPKLIVLAGFMRILTSDFVKQFEGKMINIHPALLPKYKGLNTHQRALDNGDSIHGATVHFVTPELDDGPNILQASLQVNQVESSETLASRVLVLEHKIYPMVVDWFMNDRVKMFENQCYLDQYLLPDTGYELNNEAEDAGI